MSIVPAVPHRVTGTGPVDEQSPRDVKPWGFWATLIWSLLACGVGIASGIICIACADDATPHPEAAISDQVGYLIVTLPLLAIMAAAVKIRKWSLRDYLAIDRVSVRDVVLGVACLAALLLACEAVERLLGVDPLPDARAEYRAAQLDGTLPLLWLTIVVVAPAAEELVFRGFLHRGWSASSLGVPGTIMLTSALWAMLHVEYHWLDIFFIFCMGLMLGWLRQRSGSTTLPIVLHALNNLIATAILAVTVQWPG